MTAIHFVDFETSEEKGDFLNTTIGHLRLNGGSNKQGNRGVLRKIYVARQFFEASFPQCHFFEKNEKLVFRCGLGKRVPNVRSVSFFVWPGGVTQTNTYTHIQVTIGISYTG